MSLQRRKDSLTKIVHVVDGEFMEKVLRDSEKDASIVVIDVSIKNATNKGDNYTSDMFRATVAYSRQLGDDAANRATERKSVIVKVEPLVNGIQKELISKSSLFTTEIQMMSDTLAKMNELLGPEQPLSGRSLYTRKVPPMLVIEDLAPLGFRMADRRAGLDLDHCLLAVRGLARFHASSVALCEREPEQKQRVTRGMFSTKQPPEMQAFFSEGTKQLGLEVATWSELDSTISEKVLKMAPRVYEVGCEASRCNDSEFNVINHGDFWVNNMLFKYDGEQPVGHIFVDFQLCLYSSPAVDLQYLFNTSLSNAVLAANEQRLLDEYLRELGATMSRLGCRTEPPRPEQLREAMRERAAYGMITSFTILPVLLQRAEEAKDLNEIMDHGGEYNNPAYKTAEYREQMVERLANFHRMGLLD